MSIERIVVLSEWCCGDDECDCYQSSIRVEKYEDGKYKGFETISEGPFLSMGYGPCHEDAEAYDKWADEARSWYFLPPTV